MSYIINRPSGKRALIVGQAPGRTHDPGIPISGQTRDRLIDLMGITPDMFPLLVDRANVIDFFPGRAETGDMFPALAARKGAKRIWQGHAMDYDWILLLGQGVVDAFFHEGDVCEWVYNDEYSVYVGHLPHPSGVNRWWNDAEHYVKGKRFMREWVMSLTSNDRIGGDNADLRSGRANESRQNNPDPPYC